MNQQRLFDLLKSLMSIPSLTGDEKPLAEFVESYFTERNFKVQRQSVNNDRFNLFARQGERTKLILCTHLDTVSPHIAYREDDEIIYGRGACDAKGAMAAMIETALTWYEQGGDQVGLLFLVDEEMNSAGAKLANQNPLFRSEYLIVGEPTENRLAIGQKGSLILRLTASGKAAHSAFPELGESATAKLINVLQDLLNLDYPNDDFFGETTLNIGTLQGGSRVNIIADQAKSEMIYRLSVPVHQLLKQIEPVINQRVEMDILSQSDPSRMIEIPGFETFIASFGSDTPYLTQFGQRIMAGPGSILHAHTNKEKIGKKDLVKGVEMYLRILGYLIKQ